MSLQEDFGGDVELLASFNQNTDEFLGLLAMSMAGMHVRADGMWHLVSGSNRYFMGSQVATVEEDFLDFFDKLDARNNTPTKKQVMSYIIFDDDDEDVAEVETTEEGATAE